jgi:hypothetical protein
MIQAKPWAATTKLKNNALQYMPWTEAEFLCLLCYVPRLICRGQHWLEGNCCCQWKINSVQKLYDHTT